MAAIDSILGLVVQQGANELRVGTDREPEMYRDGARLRLALDPTPEETLRLLLGPLLTTEREEVLGQGSVVECVYEVSGVGTFQVVMTRREAATGIDILFLRGGQRRAAASPTPKAAPVSAPQPLAPRIAINEQRPSASLVALLEHAVALRASDLHLREGEPPAVRIDGVLQTILADPLTDLADLLGESLGYKCEEAAASQRSIDTAFEVRGVGRFRLNVYAASSQACASIRVLPPSVPALASLQLGVAVDDLVDLPHGLVIVCGPTGSGKSTTLAALAQEALRRKPLMLITLEDPIEYRLRPSGNGSLVRQREIGADLRDFPTGLRDALREDPDILLIGEMRDTESIGLTLTAAETGHLVLASMHSRSAASAVERVVDSYPPERQLQIRVQLADSLRAVISQRLLPRALGEGRIPAIEVLRVNYNVANLIREGRTAQIATAMQAGRKEGQMPLERCLADLVLAGQVLLEDARAVANDWPALQGYLHT